MSDNSSQDMRKPGGPRAVSDVLSKVLEPTVARRTGMRLDLIKAWPELAGETFAQVTKPEKIDWPRRFHEDDPFKPAVLVVACEPSVALFFQHSQKDIIERVNLFFGFNAIERIRLLQKSVIKNEEPRSKPAEALTPLQKQSLEKRLAKVEDESLRETLRALGTGILSRAK